jgi:hypothetical protein
MSKFSQEDDDLLDELGVEVEVKKAGSLSAKEARIIAGFEEIQKFVEEHGCVPTRGEGNDIFERIYAVRLEQINRQAECRNLVEPMDHQGILGSLNEDTSLVDDLDDDDLLDALGVEVETEGTIQALKHVRPSAEIRAAEEIANREKCEDFEKFKPMFDQVKNDLQTKRRELIVCENKSVVNIGDLFVVQGQTAFIVDADDLFLNDEGREDRRLRVIFNNGTESRMLRRSFQKRLWEDHTARRITNPNDLGPLFSNEAGEGDLESGVLYVLRSQSIHPEIAKNRELIHKIGFTTGSVERRVADAENQATYLLANVEVVATYKLYNINANRLENLIHRFLEAAKLDIEINDRFGKPFKPREWFLVPLSIIEEAMLRLQDGTIVDHIYDPVEVRIVKHASQ